MALDHIALEQQVESGIGEELVAFRVDEAVGLLDLAAAVGIQDAAEVEPLVGQMAQLVIEGRDVQLLPLPVHIAAELVVEQTRRDELPLRLLGAGELDGRLGQGRELLGRVHAACDEDAGLGPELGKRILESAVVLLDAGEHFIKALVADEGHKLPALLPHEGACLPVEDVGLGSLVVALAHQGLLHEVLDSLDAELVELGGLGADRGCDGIKLLL